MGESQLDARLGLGRLPILGATLQQDPGQLFSRRVRKPQGTDFMAGGVVLRAQLLCDPQAGVTVFLEEAEEIIAFHEVDLAWVHGFRPELVGLTAHRGAQAQNFSRFGDLQDQSFAVSRAHGQLHTTLAENKNPSWRLALNKEDRALGIRRRVLDGLERLQRSGWKITKDMVCPHLARQAAFDDVQTVWCQHNDSPVTSNRISVFHGQNARRCDSRAETADAALIPRHAPARVRAVTCPGDLRDHGKGALRGYTRFSALAELL